MHETKIKEFVDGFAASIISKETGEITLRTASSILDVGGRRVRLILDPPRKVRSKLEITDRVINALIADGQPRSIAVIANRLKADQKTVIAALDELLGRGEINAVIRDRKYRGKQVINYAAADKVE